MIAFVTSLRHPQNSSCYPTVETLLQETLGSITAQTDGDFVVIVVGNQRPSFSLGPKVHFVEVDFPPPVNSSGPQFALGPFVWDKGTKIGIGLVKAREFDPTHVMIFDADDFASNRIAAHVHAQRPELVHVVHDGYMYSRSRSTIRQISEFNRTCGTCFVIPWSVCRFPDDPRLDATQGQIAGPYGEFLPRILGAHRNAEEWLIEQGSVVTPFPFRAAVYHVDTGENHSGKAMTGLGRPLSERLSVEFGIPARRSGFSLWWSALGPHHLVESSVALARRLLRPFKRLLTREAKQRQ